MTTPNLDVIVIGGGQAGLAVAYHLKRQGANFVVLDAGHRSGHSWRSRWDSLTLFTPAQYCSLPGRPFPAPKDSHPAKDQVADYLEGYVEAFELPVQHNQPVLSLTRSHGGFIAQTPTAVWTAGQVVVATGPFQAPFVPRLSAGLSADVAQIHTSEYRNPGSLPSGGGPVVVVGAGNSGVQIAVELAATRKVHLAVGQEAKMAPQRILGKDLFWWLSRSGVLTKPADGSRLARRLRDRGELVIGTRQRDLTNVGVCRRPRLMEAHGSRVGFADGSSETVAAVVWATGFRPEYSWIEIEGIRRGGPISHVRGVTDTPGLYFVGLPWQHTRGSALLGFVGADAEFVADRIARDRRERVAIAQPLVAS